jgi:UTP-glucose-1-phosphate uridylyltransferase
VTGSDATRVVVCAGGLGTRIAGWARYIPKEFYPVDGRPGIVHLMEEIAQAAPAEAVVVCHPYYRGFTAWARTVLSEDAHDEYTRAARLPASPAPAAGVTVTFIAQSGPYADLSSVLNGAAYFRQPGDLYIAFADNLYPSTNPLCALRAAGYGYTAVLASDYQRELAATYGVMVTAQRDGQFLLRDLIEKPDPRTARELERRYGRHRLRLLEGRARLTPDFIGYARSYQTPPGTEPKLSAVIAAYADPPRPTHPCCRARHRPRHRST